MKPTLADIHRHRALLITRAAGQREKLARITQPWRAPLAFADRGIAFVHAVRRHPFVVALAAAVLSRIVFGKQRVWIKRIWDVWRIIRHIAF